MCYYPYHYYYYSFGLFYAHGAFSHVSRCNHSFFYQLGTGGVVESYTHKVQVVGEECTLWFAKG